MRLSAENLAGERGGQIVFSDMAFDLGPGQALVVTGPNGSGKSTLLRIIAGLLPPARGRLTYEDGGPETTLAQACHYLGHQNAMKQTLTIAENLRFWRDFLGDPYLAIGEAMQRVGLESLGHLPFGSLSAGQRRRVAIARLLVSRRPVWLLDEPTAGLDRISEARFSEVMRNHLAEGGMVVAATHLPLGLDGTKELRLGKILAQTHPSLWEGSSREADRGGQI